MNTEEIRRQERRGLRMIVRTAIAFIVIVVVFAICGLTVGCTTTKEVDSSVTDRHVTDMMLRMDSVLRFKTVSQQDSTWRQEILRQFQSIREKSDTSHYVVVDSVGNVIRERVVINNTREVTSETDRQEREVMMHRLEQMDSTMNIMRQQISHSDSLLQQKEKTITKIEKAPLSWWQNLRIWVGNIAFIALALWLGVWLWKKKKSLI